MVNDNIIYRCVKITDFGLNEFKQSQDEPDK